MAVLGWRFYPSASGSKWAAAHEGFDSGDIRGEDQFVLKAFESVRFQDDLMIRHAGDVIIQAAPSSL
jgi:hypothetical protein